MRKMKKLAIAEDHSLMREGLKALLNASEKFEIVAEAKDGLEAVRCVEKHKPDLILLDLAMPKMNGLSAIKEIKSRFRETKVLALTAHESEEYILEALKSGANGYCLKNARRSDLLSAIETVLAGRPYLSPGVSQKVLEGYLEDRKTIKERSSWDTLTHREKDVLKLIGEDYRNKEIADYLCISVKTVEKHRSNLMKKLDLHSASSLTAYAIQKGLVAKEV